MSGLRGRVYATPKLTTLIAIIFSLTAVLLLCTVLNFPRALAAAIVSGNFNDYTETWNSSISTSSILFELEGGTSQLEAHPPGKVIFDTLSNGFTYSMSDTVVVSDEFNDNSLDEAKWNANDLFSGFTNTDVPIAETSPRLEIGPLLQNVSGSSYRGIRTVTTYNFTGAYAYVELVQAPASNTAADAMFTLGNDVNNYYRIYVSAGNLIGLKKIAGIKTTLFSIPYDTTNHRFLRIRHDATANSVTLDTATGSGGVPGTWVQRYTETWNSSISTAAMLFEFKGGTSQVEANPPGKVIFDNFNVAVPASAAQISNISVAVNCNSSVLINFRTNVPSRAFIEYGMTTNYGNSTIDDPVRFYTEHAVQLTGLSASTTYHFRVNANRNGLLQSADQVVTTASSGAVCPAQPVQVDSRMPDMTGAVEYVVKASCTGVSNCFTNFQSALDTAGTDSGKRFITVDTGLNFTGSFTLPANADQNWIIIRSSAYASLPEGQRVSPSDASNMFKVTQNSQVNGAIESAAGSNHIRIIGMEATIDPSTASDAPGGAVIHAVVNFNKNVAGSAANLAKFIGIDRSYIHGLKSKNNRRGVYWEGENNFIIDSYISEFHDINSDGQAILSVTSKRGKILNNTLISDGENFMWGGAGLSVSGYVVGGLEFARNHMYKPCSWKEDGGCGATYGGFDWKEKNLFECKTCAQTLVFANYFGGATDSQGGFWPDAQSKAINIKLEQDSVGPTTCDRMEDITLYKNLVKNVHAGFDVVGRTVPAQGCTNIPDRVLLLHNVLEADATTWNPEPGADSRSFNAEGFQLGGTEDLQVIHNSIVNANPTQSSTCNSVYGDGSLAVLGDPTANKWAGFVFKDNFGDYRACGVSSTDNINNALGALNGHFTGWVFTNNGIMRSRGTPANFPTGNVFVNSWSGLFSNFNNGLDGNYRVVALSAFHKAASDGTDLGADIDGVENATANCPTGHWPSP